MQPLEGRHEHGLYFGRFNTRGHDDHYFWVEDLKDQYIWRETEFLSPLAMHDGLDSSQWPNVAIEI